MLPAVLLAAYALVQAAIGYGAPSLTLGATKNGHVAYVARFEALREHLAGAPVAGYVPRRSPSDTLSHGAYFFLAQYALAPTLLARNAEPTLVVGNFNTREAQHEFLEKTPLTIVSDFGNGVVLFRNAAHEPTR